MNGSDFIALADFMKTVLISVFTCLDSVTIVEADGYKLTCLTFGITVAFLIVIAKIYQKLTE